MTRTVYNYDDPVLADNVQDKHLLSDIQSQAQTRALVNFSLLGPKTEQDRGHYNALLFAVAHFLEDADGVEDNDKHFNTLVWEQNKGAHVPYLQVYFNAMDRIHTAAEDLSDNKIAEIIDEEIYDHNNNYNFIQEAYQNGLTTKDHSENRKRKVPATLYHQAIKAVLQNTDNTKTPEAIVDKVIANNSFNGDTNTKTLIYANVKKAVAYARTTRDLIHANVQNALGYITDYEGKADDLRVAEKRAVIAKARRGLLDHDMFGTESAISPEFYSPLLFAIEEHLEDVQGIAENDRAFYATVWSADVPNESKPPYVMAFYNAIQDVLNNEPVEISDSVTDPKVRAILPQAAEAAARYIRSYQGLENDERGHELEYVKRITLAFGVYSKTKEKILRVQHQLQDDVMEDLRRAQPLFGAILTYVNKVIFDAAEQQGIPASDYDLLQMRNAFFIELTQQFAHEYAKPEANFTHDELQNRLVSSAYIDGFLTYQLKNGSGKPAVDASGQPIPATPAPTFLKDGSFPIGQMIFKDQATRDIYKNILDRAKTAADECLVPLLQGKAIPKVLRPKLTTAVNEAAQKSSPLGQFFLGGQAVAINLDQPIPVKLARGADDQAARQFMLGEITKFFEFSVPEQIAQVHHSIFRGTVDQTTSQQLHGKLTAKPTAGRTKDLIATATAINDNTDSLLQQTLPDGTRLQHSTGNEHTTHTYDVLTAREQHNHSVAEDRFKQKIGTGIGTVLLTALLIGLQFVPGVGQGVMIALIVFAVIAFVAGAALTTGLHVSQKRAESNERKLGNAAQHAKDIVHQQQQELEGTGVTTADLPGSLVSKTAMDHRAKHGYSGVTANHYIRSQAANAPKVVQFAADDSDISSDSEHSSEDPGSSGSKSNSSSNSKSSGSGSSSSSQSSREESSEEESSERDSSSHASKVSSSQSSREESSEEESSERDGSSYASKVSSSHSSQSSREESSEEESSERDGSSYASKVSSSHSSQSSREEDSEEESSERDSSSHASKVSSSSSRSISATL